MRFHQSVSELRSLGILNCRRHTTSHSCHPYHPCGHHKEIHNCIIIIIIIIIRSSVHLFICGHVELMVEMTRDDTRWNLMTWDDTSWPGMTLDDTRWNLMTWDWHGMTRNETGWQGGMGWHKLTRYDTGWQDDTELRRRLTVWYIPWLEKLSNPKQNLST